jgi:hypothetical protein
MCHTDPVKRMTVDELDLVAARLEHIRREEETLRLKLQEQVEEFGFTPPRAEKSKRLAGTLYQFTVSRGVTTEIKDVEVERIREICPGVLFDRLFRTVTKFKLADTATQVLASRLPVDAPRNLRLMFSRAVETKETAPRLRIEQIVAECATTTTAG